MTQTEDPHMPRPRPGTIASGQTATPPAGRHAHPYAITVDLCDCPTHGRYKPRHRRP